MWAVDRSVNPSLDGNINWISPGRRAETALVPVVNPVKLTPGARPIAPVKFLLISNL